MSLEDNRLIDDALFGDVIEESAEQLPPLHNIGRGSRDIVVPATHNNSRLKVVLKENESDVVVQDIIREELAEQVLILSDLRDRAERDDLAARTLITEKIVTALKKVSDLTTAKTKEAREKSGGIVDFHSEKFKDVLFLLTELIVEAVKETGLDETSSQRFYQKLKTKLMGFEDAAASVYNGKGGLDKKKQEAANQSAFAKTRD